MPSLTIYCPSCGHRPTRSYETGKEQVEPMRVSADHLEQLVADVAKQTCPLCGAKLAVQVEDDAS